MKTRQLLPLSCALALACASHQGSSSKPELAEASTAAPKPAPAPPPLDLAAHREPVEKLVRTALRDGQAYTMLSELCNVAPHRLAGSEGAARAVQWARETMLRAGLENVRLETCTVPRWERGDAAELTIVAREGADASTPSEPLPILALGGSVGTPSEGIEAEVVEVKSFEELTALGAAAQGKIVFFNRPMDASNIDTFQAYGGAVNQRWGGASAAARAGGVAAIVRSMTTRLDDLPHTGSMGYEKDVERVPTAAVSTRGAERLSALIQSGARPRLRLVLGCRTLEDVESFNVVGEIVGRETPSEIVLVGGHLDAWDIGQGAHDDGSGSCQSIEALRLVRECGLRPRRTLRAVLFMNEENGLRGGRAYKATHAAELEHHVLALESDRGGFAPRGFETDANPDALRVLRAAAGLLDFAGAGSLVGCERGGAGADISPLAASGVITAGLVPDPQRYFDMHHCARDTIAEVSPRELELGAAAMASLLYVVAELPEPLPRNAVQPPEPAR